MYKAKVKKSVIFQILLLISCFFKTSHSYSLSKDEACKIGSLVIGTVAVGGISALIYNWYYNSNLYHKSVIEDANLTYRKAGKYLNLINILQDQYNIKIVNISELQKRSVIDSINESFLTQIALTFSKVECCQYLDELKLVINGLKNFENKLEWSNSKLVTNDRPDLYNQVNNLLKAYREIIPQTEFLSSYLENHKDYFRAYNMVQDLYAYYQSALKISYNNYDTYVPELLKKEICYKYYDKGIMYPYLRYVDTLNNNISKINNSSTKLKYGYKHLSQQIKNLLANLEIIKKHIVSDNDFLQQKEKFFQDEQRKQKIEFEQKMKQRELELIEQKNRENYYLKQREVQAREIEAAARQAEVIANQLKPQQPPAQVHVHIQNNRQKKNKPFSIPVVMPTPSAPLEFE